MFPVAKWGSQMFDLAKLANSCHVKWNKRSFFLPPFLISFCKAVLLLLLFPFNCQLRWGRRLSLTAQNDIKPWLSFWSDYNSLARQEIHTRFAGYISCVYLERRNKKKSLAAQVPYYLNAYVRRLRRGSYTSVSSLGVRQKYSLHLAYGY